MLKVNRIKEEMEVAVCRPADLHLLLTTYHSGNDSGGVHTHTPTPAPTPVTTTTPTPTSAHPHLHPHPHPHTHLCCQGTRTTVASAAAHPLCLRVGTRCTCRAGVRSAHAGRYAGVWCGALQTARAPCEGTLGGRVLGRRGRTRQAATCTQREGESMNGRGKLVCVWCGAF